MKSRLASVVAGIIFVGVAGCQAPMQTVLSLENPASNPDAKAATRPVNLRIAAPVMGTYYLYSSKKADPIYDNDLRQGDELGFQASGDRAWGVNKGIRVELDDYDKGASYTWKVKEARKD